MPAMPRIWFYQSRDFVPHSFKTVSRKLDRSRVHCAEKFAPQLHLLLQYFEEVTFERAGTLTGEYAMTGAPVLVRRDGLIVKTGLSGEDPWVGRMIDELCLDGDFQATLANVYQSWDELPVVEHEPILNHPYCQNYYHWSMEAVPGQRLFGHWASNRVLIPELNLRRMFQRDLLARTAEGRVYVPVPGAAVVRNPILASEFMSEETVWWLRRKAGISITAGRRRIYLRRSTTGSRRGSKGGICETSQFLDFLKENSFETVDFGGKEMTIDEQVGLLDGAAVILAPHGAALTNLVYLNPPLKVIEVMGAHTPRAMFMHISSLCGFDHHVVFSGSYGEDGDLVVDVDDLREALVASDPPHPA